MSRAAGFIIRLSLERQNLFEIAHQEGIFAEPVSEFSHSRNVPLLCFIVDSSESITHISLGKRGRLAGTDLRRLNLEKIFKLKNTASISQILNNAPPRAKKKIQEKLKNGGLLPPKSFEALIQIISTLSPEAAQILQRYSEERIKRIGNLPQKTKESLAQQKEAVATALTIAGIDRDELSGWDVIKDKETTSFLDGLDQVRLREDPMVVNDLINLPGHEIIKTAPFSSVVFENTQSKLTVILANRLPLEKQLV